MQTSNWQTAWLILFTLANILFYVTVIFVAWKGFAQVRLMIRSPDENLDEEMGH